MTADKPEREFCAYLRVSDEAGREGSTFHSPEVQRDRIKVVVEGLHKSKVVAEFEDMSFTGRVMERPGLIDAVQWVMEDPRRRGIATLNVSRLARNTKGIIELVLDTLVPAGAVFVSAEQMIDTSTAYGRKQLRDLASDAEAQSDMIGETWSRVLLRRAESGRHPTGKRIYGYRVEPDPADPKGKSRLLVPDEEGGTAEVVRRMYRFYNGGTGVREIARILNEEGVPSPGGSTWGISTVKRTLESKAYHGVLEFKGREIEAAWPPLISKAAWDTFLSERRRRSKAVKRGQVPKWPLGGGLSVCGKCGASLSVNSLASPKGLVMCGNYRGGRGCDGVFMLRWKFDGQFAIMLHLHWQQEVTSAASARRDAEAESAREEAEAAIRAGEDRLEVVASARTRLAKQNAEGLITDDELAKALREYADEAGEVRDQIAAARDRLAAAAPLGDAWERLLGDFSEDADTEELAAAVASSQRDMTPSEWSRTLAKVVKRVELHEDRIAFVPVVGDKQEVAREPRKFRRKPPTAKRVEWDQPVEPGATDEGAA